MRTEEQCKPNERFLFANLYLPDDTIKEFQRDCEKRLKNRVKDDLYYRFINWVRRDNEIAVFTMYAYADFPIPKTFDIIFRRDNPQEFIKIDYELTQSIWEGWVPINNIEDGHKHLCVFTFNAAVPQLLFSLTKIEGPISSWGEITLGFCRSTDFPAITQRLKKTDQLKSQYGNNWDDFDDGE